MTPTVYPAHLLLVEDDAINLFVARKLLGKHHQIDSAVNHREAFQLLELQNFDVILLDINLGGDSLDGVAILRHIRQRYPEWNVPVFAVTSYAMSEDRVKYLKAGFDRYFPKPINRFEILNAIEEELFKARNQKKRGVG